MPRSLQLLLLVAVAACYRNTDPGQMESCSGDTFVVVSNNWTRAVDVYVWQDGRANVVGTVTAGSSGQFPVPNRRTPVGVREEGSSSSSAPIGPTSPVQTRYICR